MTEEPKVTIVSAAGTAGGAGPGLNSQVMDEALKNAVMKAINEGVTDQDEIRRRIVQARDDLVKQYGSS